MRVERHYRVSGIGGVGEEGVDDMVQERGGNPARTMGGERAKGGDVKVLVGGLCCKRGGEWRVPKRFWSRGGGGGGGR